MSNGSFAEADTKKLLMSYYFVRWLEASESTLRRSSHRRYKEMTNNHFIPFFGKMLLDKLSPLDVQRFYANRLADGLSQTTVNLYHNILHSALKQAVRWGLIIRNVCDSVDAPREVQREKDTWNARQVGSFFAVSDRDEYAAFWRLAVLTGMRWSEMIMIWRELRSQRDVH